MKRCLIATLLFLALAGSSAEARTSSVYITASHAERIVLRVNYRLDYVQCIGYGQELREGDGRFRRFSCVAGKRSCVYAFTLHNTTQGLRYRAFDSVCSPDNEPEVLP